MSKSWLAFLGVLLFLPTLCMGDVLIFKYGFYMDNIVCVDVKPTFDGRIYYFKDGATNKFFSLNEAYIKNLSSEKPDVQNLIPLTLDTLATYINLAKAKDEEHLPKPSAIAGQGTAEQNLAEKKEDRQASSNSTPPENTSGKNSKASEATGFLTRTYAMGHTSIAVNDNLNSVIGNPAGIGPISTLDIGLAYGAILEYNYQQPPKPLDTKSLSVAFPIIKAINVGIALAEIKKFYNFYYLIPGYNDPNLYTHYYSSIQTVVGLSFKPNDFITVGISNGSFENASNFTAGLMITPATVWRLGIIWKEFDDYGMPGIGLAYHFKNTELGFNGLATTEVQTRTSDNYLQFNLGSELEIRNFFVLRAGFYSKRSNSIAFNNWLTMGIGVSFLDSTLDITLNRSLDEISTTSAYASLGFAL